MAAIQLHHSSDVGTTYKRALPRLNLARDRYVSPCFSIIKAISQFLHYHDSILQRWSYTVRKPRDFDSELKALTDKTRLLKDKKVRQLGELVIATGADGLDPNVLTGALLGIVETTDANAREGWRARGSAFFRSQTRSVGGRTQRNTAGDQARQVDGTAD
jgi:Conjugal transfer protein TraD